MNKEFFSFDPDSGEKVTFIASENQYSRFTLLEELSEENEYEVEIPDYELFNIAKYIIENPDKYLFLSDRDIKLLGILDYKNPLNYPQEYYEIYERERFYRNLNGYDHLKDITKIAYVPKHIPDVIKIKNLNNYESINAGHMTKSYILNLLLMYSDHLVIAGGAALQYYYYNNSLYQDNTFSILKDIDVFFHSCDENYIKSVIVHILIRINNYFVPTFFEHYDISQTENCITLTLYNGKWLETKNLKIQFIKRIYRSPSEIIHGFDVDSSCILLDFSKDIKYISDMFDEIKEIPKFNEKNYKRLFEIFVSEFRNLYYSFLRNDYKEDEYILDTKSLGNLSNEYERGDFNIEMKYTKGKWKIYATERCIHALKHKCNMINFERLSPSYEYRNIKYGQRGFDIYVPQVEYFKDNIIGNLGKYAGGSDILVRYLLFNSVKNIKSDYDFNCNMYYLQDKISFAVGTKYSKNFSLNGRNGMLRILDEFFSEMNFKTLNPQEQTINTFHRIVLENPKIWYPRSDLPIENFVPDFSLIKNKNIITIQKVLQREIYSPNVFCRKSTRHNVTGRSKKIFFPYVEDKLSYNGYLLVGENVRNFLYEEKQSKELDIVIVNNDASFLSIVKEYFKLIEVELLKIFPLLNKMKYVIYFIVDDDIYYSELYNKYRLQFEEAFEKYDEEETDEYFSLFLDKEINNINSSFLQNVNSKDILKEFPNKESFGIRFSLEFDPRFEVGKKEFIGEYDIQSTTISFPIPKISFLLNVNISQDVLQNILQTQYLDYNRIIFDGNNFYTDALGKFAIENKIHFSSKYEDACDNDRYQKLLFPKSMSYRPINKYESLGYSFYDSQLLAEKIKYRE